MQMRLGASAMDHLLLTALLLLLSQLGVMSGIRCENTPYAPVEGGLGDNLVRTLEDVSIQVR